MEEDHSRRQEIAVGVLVLAAIVGLVYLSFRVGGGRPPRAVTYVLLFDSALGLQNDNVVTVAGVRVGLVESISVQDRKARVEIAVSPDLTLYSDASAAVRARTLLGEKYIDLDPGDEQGSHLPPGAQIARTVPTVEIDQVIRGTQEIIARANGILPTLQAAVEKIDGLVRRSDVEAGARSLSEMLDETTSLIRTLSQLSRSSGDDLKTVLSMLRKRGPEILQRIETSAERLDRLAAAVPAEALAEAINRAPQAVDNADRALADLRVAVSDLRSMSSEGADVVGRLDRLLKRLEKLDEKTVREFLQVQGVRVNFTPSATIERRVRELKHRELPPPISPTEEE